MPSRAPGCMPHWLTAWWRPSGLDASTRSGHLHGTLKQPAALMDCILRLHLQTEGTRPVNVVLLLLRLLLTAASS